MQLFPEFNAHFAAKHFDADAFTIILHLGGCNFYRLTSSTNQVYKNGKGKRPTYLRMALQPNEGGFDRMKIHHIADGMVRMEFYSLTWMPSMKPLKSKSIVVEDVPFDEMFSKFIEVTGFEMEAPDI